MATRLVTLLVALTLLGAAGAEAKGGKRLFISADMEGVAGVVTGDQLSTSGFEYESFRGFMTEEVNARAARSPRTRLAWKA